MQHYEFESTSRFASVVINVSEVYKLRKNLPSENTGMSTPILNILLFDTARPVTQGLVVLLL
jgi:hypothetical protein